MPARQKALARGEPHPSMTHIAIQESLNGTNVEWLEKVTDEQYLGRAAKEPT
jgi:hypothetical protein